MWLAREENTGKHVAVKFYTHRRGLDWSLLNREVEKLAVLYTSRNIVRLLDVGWDSDPPYYVMEYLEKGSLACCLAQGPLSVNEAVRITRSIAQALVQAHGAGILHCDLKPANVLLDSNFDPRLCDFGQSRLTNEQSPALGTLFYMAREQANLHAIPDARWDVYALGALLYHMLCGEPPHRSPENEQRIREAGDLKERLEAYSNILCRSLPPEKHRKVPGVDGGLVEIADRCLQVDPEKRLPNAQSVLDALELRDRQRARRPLIALGIIGPALLLTAMAPLFMTVIQHSADATETEIRRGALEAHSLTAKGLAIGLEQEVDRRLGELESVARIIGPQIASDQNFQDITRRFASAENGIPADAVLQELVAELTRLNNTAPETRPDWIRLLDEARAESDSTAENHQGTTAAERDTSWFMADAWGNQLWRRKFDPDTISRNYSFRDYFNGSGTDSPEHVHVGDQHITTPYISIPFRSQATDRYMVAMSVPVANAAGNFIGVLARTTHLGAIRRQFGQLFGRDQYVIALADTRNGQILDHHWLSPPESESGQSSDERNDSQTIDMDPDKLFEQLHLSPRLQQELFANGHELEIDDYEDPVGAINHPSAREYDVEWMAATAPVSSARWMVIVQQKTSTALQPVEDLTTRLANIGLLALLISAGLVGLLWFFVARALNSRTSEDWFSAIVRSATPSTSTARSLGSR